MTPARNQLIQFGLPKGRMYDGVLSLLADAGIRVSVSSRGYRPAINLPGFEAKILKPQSIVEMLDAGSRDVGFAGADWVKELNADVVELLDTGLDKVRLVAAAPRSLLELDRGRKLPARSLIVASEMENLARAWIKSRNQNDRFVRSFGATEVLPPEDADCIIDIAASGATLEANNLEIVAVLMESSTRLYASQEAMEDESRRSEIEKLVMLLRSVIDARERVMLELNVPSERLEAIVKVLPCMREPTVSALHGGAGYAVKAAVPRSETLRLIPLLKAQGGSGIVISRFTQVVP